MQETIKKLVLLAMTVITTAAFSQSVTVTADIDSTTIPIGQQSGFHINITGPSSVHYTFPSFSGDTLVKGIELLSRGNVDTTLTDNGYINLKANYLITSFDSGLHYIPPIKILAGMDTVESNMLALKVLTYNVDTTNYALFDIKGPQSPPFVLTDYLLPVLLILVIMALVALSWWLIRKYRQKGTQSEEEARLASLPPHIIAIMELDKLKVEKLWIIGRNKEFHTRVSDILRTYIERRFQINALEMTTVEILFLFSKDKITQSVYQNLKQILQLADLVKFAKFTPQENENELSLMNAYLFVNQTKVEEIQSVDELLDTTQEQQDVSMTSVAQQTEPDDYLKKYQKK